MNISTLKVLAAGLTACVCLSGLSQSANAQFFNGDRTNVQPLNNRPVAPPVQPALYDSQMRQQWPEQRRMDDRYLPTNAFNGTYDIRQNYQGRCANGECNFGPANGATGDINASYRGRRRGGQNYDAAARYRSQSFLTTGWDPGSSGVDPATGLPVERTRRHDHATGEGHHGRCEGGECSKGQCDCPDGQCDCPVGQRPDRGGQFRHHRMDQQNVPAGYDEFTRSRSNSPVRQYVPARSPYLN